MDAFAKVRSDEGEHDPHGGEQEVHEGRHGADGLRAQQMPDRWTCNDHRREHRFDDAFARGNHPEQGASDKPHGHGDHHPVTPLEVELVHDHGQTDDDGGRENDLHHEGDTGPNDAESIAASPTILVGLGATRAMRVHW